MKRGWKIFFYGWFGFVPFFCVFLDLILSTATPDPSDRGRLTAYFDLSIMNQAIYLSVWTTILIGVFGICNFINLFTKKMPHWITGKNNHTFVTVMSGMIFFLYGISLMASIFGTTKVDGFNTWYKIFKSIVEHFITPTLLIIFYFFINEEIVNEKVYATRDGWWTIIFPSVYILFIVVRGAMIYNYAPDSDYLTHDGTMNWENNSLVAFPYVCDPWKTEWYIWMPSCLGIIFAPYAVGNLLNYLSNLAIKSLNNHHYFEGFDEQKTLEINSSKKM